MNRVKQLLNEWALTSHSQSKPKAIQVKMSNQDFARLRALAELFPDRNEEQIISDLLSALLDEVEEALPYIPGKQVVTEDEFGDPVFEDIGLNQKFEILKKKYAGMN